VTIYTSKPPLKHQGCPVCDDGYQRWVPDDGGPAIHDALDFSWKCHAGGPKWVRLLVILALAITAGVLL
jgi:hypothetical protein